MRNKTSIRFLLIFNSAMNKSIPKNSGLKQILGLGFGLATVIGGAIGIGILRMPATVAGYITTPYLFITFWVIGGLISLLGASIYAEMGTRFPYAGGPFVLAQKSLGNIGGFITGWSDWIYGVGTLSFLAIATVEYMNKLLQLSLPVGIVASFLIILLTAIQWYGMRQSSNFQKIMSALKAIGLLIFVFACLFYFFNGNRYAVTSIGNSTASIPLFAAFILSLRAIFVTYAGWNSAVYFSEEDTNPGKNLPRSMIWGVISIMIIYVLVNVGLIAVLPLQEIAVSTLPAADAAQKIFGSNGDIIVTSLSIISLIGILNVGLLLTPRVLYAISKAGLFFKSTAQLNKHSIPGIALIITTIAAVLLALTGLFNLVLNVTVLFAMIVDLSVYISIIFVRNKKSGEPAPYKAWGYPFSAIFMIIITLGLIVGLFFEDTMNCVYSLIILVLAFPFYFLFKKLSGRDQSKLLHS
ncbi:MAG: amino acid permease [Chitinophagaceae bacterium]|nr:amino acid permease [Chitinophagaceae bacterium]